MPNRAIFALGEVAQHLEQSALSASAIHKTEL
jgi:hypothetical protein